LNDFEVFFSSQDLKRDKFARLFRQQSFSFSWEEEEEVFSAGF